MTSLQQNPARQRAAPDPPTQTNQPSQATPQDAIALLKSGATILLVGILSAASIYLFFGGVTHQGPHTNAGWMALMVAMMCLPFGLMLFTLGAAKYFRHKKS